MSTGYLRTVGAPKLSARDRLIIQLVGQHKQLAARHLAALAFGLPHTHTSVKRVLARLVDQRYLARIPRLVGGDGGGSAQYVYQLGRQGYRFLGRDGRYIPARAVNEHTLAIADCRVLLSTTEPAKTLTILAFETEPTCHRLVGT